MNITEAREQWLDHGLSDIIYIRLLEKELQSRTCLTCLNFKDNNPSLVCPWSNNPSGFCNQHESKEYPY